MIELALAHAIGTSTERSYNRADLFNRRRKLMEQWAEFLAQPARGDVVPMRERA